MPKQITFILLILVYSINTIMANNREDSIIIHQQHPNAVEPIVYYIKNDSCYTIEPTPFSNMRVVPFLGLKTEMSFDGQTSQNHLSQSLFYIYLSDTIQQTYNINNFRVVNLKMGDGERLLTTSINAYYYIHIGTYSKGMCAVAIDKGLYKIVPAQKMDPGEYGLFYAFSGNVPIKIYDFSIR